MNIRGPIIDPRGTTNTISRKLLYFKFIFVCCFLFDTQLCTSSNAVKLKPYAFSFAMSNSWSRQSKAFLRNLWAKHQIIFYDYWQTFSIFLTLPEDIAEYGNPPKPTLVLKKYILKYCDICWNIHLSNIFDKFGRMLNGLKFPLISFLHFLCKRGNICMF